MKEECEGRQADCKTHLCADGVSGAGLNQLHGSVVFDLVASKVEPVSDVGTPLGEAREERHALAVERLRVAALARELCIELLADVRKHVHIAILCSLNDLHDA